MRKPIIRVDGVNFAYPESNNRMILKLANLELYPGQMIALLGPNGSGKSTLARLLNGLLLPTNGRVVVDGLDTSQEQDVWEIRRKVGMVFQNPDNQLVAALVEEELAFGMENLGIPSEEMKQRINAVGGKMGLTHLLQLAPHRLSGGQRQRVAIAAVLVTEPEVLVLDEPTSMLDPSGRREILGELIRIKQMGKTIVLVTHDMTEAALADRVVILADGEIIYQGSPSDCFSQVELLKEVGLEIPPAAELAQRLRRKGFTVPESLLNEKDWVDYLCPQ